MLTWIARGWGSTPHWGTVVSFQIVSFIRPTVTVAFCWKKHLLCYHTAKLWCQFCIVRKNRDWFGIKITDNNNNNNIIVLKSTRKQKRKKSFIFVAQALESIKPIVCWSRHLDHLDYIGSQIAQAMHIIANINKLYVRGKLPKCTSH